MLASRLQQALIKRVQFIQNLLLIYSYSEILSIKIHEYQVQNELMYQRQMIMVETFRNIFRIDESFRKFYHKTCLNVFSRLHPKTKRSQAKAITRIHNVYFQFLLFFKGINQLAIARYLCDLNFQTLSENELFIKLTHTIIKYLKIKTEAIIEKLKEKIGTNRSRLSVEKQESNAYKRQIFEEIEKKEHIERKRFNNFLRKSSLTQSISKRKYNSQENPKKWTQPVRKISNQLYLTNQMLNENRDSDKCRGPSNMDWKIRIKKFQEYYSFQWGELYRLTGLSEQMQQLKAKCKSPDEMSKKQWIYENYRCLFQEMLSRNQQASNALSFFKESYHRSP